MSTRHPLRLAAALGAGAILACTASRTTPRTLPDPAAGNSAAGEDRGAFVVRLGNDTLAGEQFTRTATALTGISVVRTPAIVTREYSATLRADGTVDRFELVARRAAVTLPPQRVTMTFADGGVSVSTQVGDSAARTTRVAAGGIALPYVGNTYALFELATRAARRAARPGMDTVAFAMVAIIGRVIPATVTVLGADSMLISLDRGAPYRARVDTGGRILGLQGTPTQQVAVTRVPAVALPSLSAAQPVGTLSPTDTVQARIGTASVSVVYSRPMRRGRTILGGLVPYDSVWRTGANAATVLTTSGDLTVGGLPVPRGSYTLWTLPARSGWTLIVNRQTGQWGTEYDASRDLGRVAMTGTRPPQPAEQFRIAVNSDAGANSGTLRLTWADFEVAVPVVGR